jgi:hypothetical protein
MLMPAGVLIIIILGAIALDSTSVFVQQRDLISTTESIANDAAGSLVNREKFFADGTIELLPESDVRPFVQAALTARGVNFIEPPLITVTGRRIEIQVRIRVEFIFAKGVPGAADTTTVTATASADLVAPEADAPP